MQARPIAETDKPQLQEWIDRDPDHQGRLTPDFFFEADTNTLVFEDADGVVAYLRLSNLVRLDFQLDCVATRKQAARNMEFMLGTIDPLAAQARTSGVKELIFDSVFRPLMRFCTKRLGFHASPNEFIHRL